MGWIILEEKVTEYKLQFTGWGKIGQDLEDIRRTVKGSDQGGKE